MPRARRRFTAKLKFQVVLEALKGEKSPGQIAKAYGVHANSVGWKPIAASAGGRTTTELRERLGVAINRPGPIAPAPPWPPCSFAPPQEVF